MSFLLHFITPIVKGTYTFTIIITIIGSVSSKILRTRVLLLSVSRETRFD